MTGTSFEQKQKWFNVAKEVKRGIASPQSTTATDGDMTIQTQDKHR